jgi:DNA-binding GntR family transcriptional regulator
MTKLVDPERPGHLYEQAAAVVKDRIQSGHYRPGEQLPSMADMAEDFGISDLTMQRALYRLRDQGWIVIQQGRPTHVASRLPARDSGKEQILQQARELLAQATSLVQAIEAMKGATGHGSSAERRATPRPARSPAR